MKKLWVTACTLSVDFTPLSTYRAQNYLSLNLDKEILDIRSPISIDTVNVRDS
jgi:hypothetical protein